MKKVMISMLSVVLIFNLLLFSAASADSPVTSTPFSDAYMDIEMVEKASLTNGTISEEICRFLASPENPLEIKAAVINSIYNGPNVWDVRNNTEIFTEYTYQSSSGKIDVNSLSGDELLVIGYLVLLDDYFHPENALPFLESAKKKEPHNFTIAMIHALAHMQSDWGSIWKQAKEVVGNPGLKEDRLRDEAVNIILDYLYLYRDPRNDIAVFINDNFYIKKPEPVILGGRTYVPWRELFSALGAEADLDGRNSLVTAKKGDTAIFLALNQKQAEVNGKIITLDQPPVMHNGELMVPLRFVCEALGAEVHWDGEVRSVLVEVHD